MNIGILGTGAYGFALSSILIRNKQNVRMWTHSEEEKDSLCKTRRSNKLPDFVVSNDIEITTDINRCIKGVDLVVIAIPAFAFEQTIKKITGVIAKKTPILIATKGIQQETCLFLTDVLEKYLSNKYAVISGPTFATDIVKNIPIGFSLATKNKNVEAIVRKCFENNTTKFRRTKDVIGVELCGAVKNVMAIAAGMLEAMNISDSTRALFLTESLNDIKELIKALGGNKKTILSFAGFGDILMTCTSKVSRNFSFGCLIGGGATQKEINDYLASTTVEGMYTLKSIHKLVKKKKVKMPIINLIYDIIINGKEKEKFLEFLINKE